VHGTAEPALVFLHYWGRTSRTWRKVTRELEGQFKTVATRDFKETIRARVERDPKFRKELLREGVEAMLAGDVTTAKTILRDYINATVGFTEVAEAIDIPSKSLMRMFGPSGNPRAHNLFDVVSFLQRREGVRFQVKTTKTAQSHEWVARKLHARD
jgi:DNA-binding phage protein